jgi:hypothetical protein
MVASFRFVKDEKLLFLHNSSTLPVLHTGMFVPMVLFGTDTNL